MRCVPQCCWCRWCKAPVASPAADGGGSPLACLCVWDIWEVILVSAAAGAAGFGVFGPGLSHCQQRSGLCSGWQGSFWLASSLKVSTEAEIEHRSRFSVPLLWPKHQRNPRGAGGVSWVALKSRAGSWLGAAWRRWAPAPGQGSPWAWWGHLADHRGAYSSAVRLFAAGRHS